MHSSDSNPSLKPKFCARFARFQPRLFFWKCEHGWKSNAGFCSELDDVLTSIALFQDQSMQTAFSSRKSKSTKMSHFLNCCPPYSPSKPILRNAYITETHLFIVQNGKSLWICIVIAIMVNCDYMFGATGQFRYCRWLHARTKCFQNGKQSNPDDYQVLSKSNPC